jgi:hypothetical protein
MSTILNTADAGMAGRLRLPRRAVVLALVVALAAAALTLTTVLVTSGGSGSAAPQHSLNAAPERQYIGGPGEGAPGMRGRARTESSSAPANDSSEHSGARP